MRLLQEIEKADCLEKIDYMVNATKSFLLDLIDVSMYFRILKCITNTLPEDLKYLSEIIIVERKLLGNVNLLALEKEGLVVQTGIDANAKVEEQEYIVSSLGRNVDQYALSLDDEARQKWYKQLILNE